MIKVLFPMFVARLCQVLQYDYIYSQMSCASNPSLQAANDMCMPACWHWDSKDCQRFI